MGKNIVICCDGTSNEIKANLSNVLKLFRILKKDEEQIVFYDPGIGTLRSSNSWSRLRNRGRQIFGLATGYGLDRNILASYKFLVEHFVEGDRIYLFGFSRGAYTVRVLAGFLHMIGLLDRSQQNLSEYALVAYKQAAEQNDFEIAWRFQRVAGSRRIQIKFLGVWDTVSSVVAPALSRFTPPHLIALPYTRTNPCVEVFRQARAIDEKRRMFRLNRWTEPQEYRPNPFDPAKPTPQNIKQVWFVGDHSDVGGGYPEDESGLAKFPLAWLIDEAVLEGLVVTTAMYNHLVLGQERKGATRTYSSPDSAARIHNSMTLPWKLLEWVPKSAALREWPKRRVLLGHYLPRGEPRFIAEGDLVHYSVFEKIELDSSYRPVNLPDVDKVRVER